MVYDYQVTPKQELFAHWYVALKFNATQAAIRAGYSERTARSQGQRQLTKVDVQRVIRQKIKEALSETDQLTYEWLIDVERIQKSDLRKIMEWDADGITLKSSSELDDDAAYAISEIKETKTEAGGTLTIKLESKTKALELKGKYLAILNENPPPEQTSMDTADKKIRQERIAELLSRRNKARGTE